MKPIQCARARTMLGLTIPELAKEARITPDELLAFENGNANPSQIVKALRTALARFGASFADSSDNVWISAIGKDEPTQHYSSPASNPYMSEGRQAEEYRGRCADDLRLQGWYVAVHNDYTRQGDRWTFWLLTRDNACVRGEGPNDRYALNEIRKQLGYPQL